MKLKAFWKRWGGAILAFLLPTLAYLCIDGWDGVLPDLNSDAVLYLSVADNFLATGHFIQTARPIEGFVVPFGVPLILTAFRAIGMSVDAIVFFQHLLAGASCLLLYLAEKNHFGRGGFAPFIYWGATFRIFLMPRNIYVEIYFIFFMCLILWLLSREDMPTGKKLLWLNIAGFCAYVIRTVLLLVWLPIIVYTAICVWKGRFPLRRALALAVCFVLILAGNLLVNHRETGYWIFSDNYAGEGIYIGNNPDTVPGRYEAHRSVGEEYYAILNDPTLDQTEENDAFNAAAKRWIKENPGVFLVNTVKKFTFLFLHFWFYVPAIAVGCCIADGWRERNRGRRARMLFELGVNIALAVVTACGLIVVRYSLPVWPLAALHLAGLGHCAIAWLRKKKERRSLSVPPF